MPLSKESQYITMFVMHKGLNRYKILMSEVKSEKYQKIITDAIRGLNRVENIADDRVVYGSDLREHEKSENLVLKRLVAL